MITELQIIGQKYAVEWVKAYSVDGFSVLAGNCDSTKGMIKVALFDQDGAFRCNDAIRITFLHEIIEAINYHLQLKLEHDNIDRFASALLQTLTQVDITDIKVVK